MKYRISFIITLCGLALFFLAGPISSNSKFESKEDIVSIDQQEAPILSSRGPLFKVSTSIDYDLGEAIEIDIVSNQNPSDLSSSRIVYQSQLMLTMLNEFKDSYLFYIEFRLKDILKQKGSLSTKFVEELRSYDNISFFLKSDKDFKFVSTSSKLSQKQTAFLRRQMERINFVKKTLVKPNWEVSEYYQNDYRSFNYSRKSSTVFTKKHESSELIYEADFDFKASSFLDHASIFERIISNSPLVNTSSTSVIKLQARNISFLSQESMSKLLNEYNTLKPSSGFDLTSAVYDQDIFEKELDGFSFEDIMHLFKENMDSKDKRNTYFKMLSWIFLNPKKLSLLENEMKSSIIRHDVAAIISSALSHSGSRESKLVLISLMKHYEKENKKIVSTMINDFMVAKNADVESTRNFKTYSASLVSGTLKKQSELAIGALSNELSKNKDSQSRIESFRILNESIKSLKTAQNKDSVAHAIGILGNTKNAEIESVIKPYLNAEDANLKSEAILALRGLKTESSKRSLLKLFKSEKDENLKLLTIDSMYEKSMDMSLFNEVKKLIRTDSSTKVRAKLIYFIFENFENKFSKELKIFLEDYYETESDSYLREKVNEKIEKLQ